MGPEPAARVFSRPVPHMGPADSFGKRTIFKDLLPVRSKSGTGLPQSKTLRDFGAAKLYQNFTVFCHFSFWFSTAEAAPGHIKPHKMKFSSVVDGPEEAENFTVCLPIQGLLFQLNSEGR